MLLINVFLDQIRNGPEVEKTTWRVNNLGTFPTGSGEGLGHADERSEMWDKFQTNSRTSTLYLRRALTALHLLTTPDRPSFHAQKRSIRRVSSHVVWRLPRRTLSAVPAPVRTPVEITNLNKSDFFCEV